MLSIGMRDKPKEISRGSLGNLRVAVPSPRPKVGGGYGSITVPLSDAESAETTLEFLERAAVNLSRY